MLMSRLVYQGSEGSHVEGTERPSDSVFKIFVSGPDKRYFSEDLSEWLKLSRRWRLTVIQ